MSKTLPALIVDGQFLGYFPPSNASEIAYDSNTTVKQKIDTKADTSAIPTDFVSKVNGGTFTGDVTVDKVNSTTSMGYSTLKIGNNKAVGTEGNNVGVLSLYGNDAYMINLWAPIVTSHKNIALPDKAGTIALTSDIAVYTKTFYSHEGTASIPFTLPSTSAKHTLQIVAGANGLILSVSNSGIVSQNPFGSSNMSASYNTQNQTIDITGGEWYTTGFIISSIPIQ